jgi:ribosomal protein L2
MKITYYCTLLKYEVVGNVNIFKHLNYFYFGFFLITSTKVLCTSNGSFFKISVYDDYKSYCNIKLPSTKYLNVNPNNIFFNGRSAGVLSNLVIKGGFRNKLTTSLLKLKIKVRGVAQNPVDHPNGGRTKSKNPLLTP